MILLPLYVIGFMTQRAIFQSLIRYLMPSNRQAMVKYLLGNLQRHLRRLVVDVSLERPIVSTVNSVSAVGSAI
jgi:hypothetical protein